MKGHLSRLIDGWIQCDIGNHRFCGTEICKAVYFNDNDCCYVVGNTGDRHEWTGEGVHERNNLSFCLLYLISIISKSEMGLRWFQRIYLTVSVDRSTGKQVRQMIVCNCFAVGSSFIRA